VDLGLQGKYALVTGGSHGIGLAIASSLAEEGCHIAICSRSRERLFKAENFLKRKGVEVLSFVADVLNTSDIEKTVSGILKKWGTLHILVNNVGGGGRWGNESVEETSDKVWSDVYNKNAGAALQFTRLILPAMRRQKWGRIVTISSICGLEATGRPWYVVAKSAEISLMKSLAVRSELVRDGITFNSIAPGTVMIPNTGWEEKMEEDPKGHRAMLDKQFPLGRMGTPEEIANAVVFVCSQKASFINGSCIAVDGGERKGF